MSARRTPEYPELAGQNFPKVRTPVGTALWANLNTPDTKYKAEGKYTVKLAFEADTDISDLREQVSALIDAKYDEVVEEITEKLTKQGKKGLIKKTVDAIEKVDPFKAEEDGDTGEETGRIIINAAMTASGISKKTNKPWKRKPDIFSARGKKLDRPPQIGSGSTMKLNVELFPYYAPNDKTVGVSFRLNAAQLLTLVQFGERDASGYGFEEEEGDDLDNVEAFEDETSGDKDDGDVGDGL